MITTINRLKALIKISTVIKFYSYTQQTLYYDNLIKMLEKTILKYLKILIYLKIFIENIMQNITIGFC